MKKNPNRNPHEIVVPGSKPRASIIQFLTILTLFLTNISEEHRNYSLQRCYSTLTSHNRDWRFLGDTLSCFWQTNMNKIMWSMRIVLEFLRIVCESRIYCQTVYNFFFWIWIEFSLKICKDIFPLRENISEHESSENWSVFICSWPICFWKISKHVDGFCSNQELILLEIKVAV